MSFEIGPPAPYQPSTRARAVPAPRGEFTFDFARPATAAPVRDSVELSLSAFPPAQVRDEIGAAAARVDELRAENRELHFRKDEDSGCIVVEVRDLDGNVIRTIPPSEALGVMSGTSL
jgi:flagellar protein FlaG